MVFASLRFDDAVHVKPSELILTDEGLFGVAWQTKVERKRRGTKFVVPHVGFADSGWLLAGWSIFQLESLDRDYWMRDLNTRDAFRDAPAAYQRSVQWLRHLAKLNELTPHIQGSGVPSPRSWRMAQGMAGSMAAKDSQGTWPCCAR